MRMYVRSLVCKTCRIASHHSVTYRDRGQEARLNTPSNRKLNLHAELYHIEYSTYIYINNISPWYQKEDHPEGWNRGS